MFQQNLHLSHPLQTCSWANVVFGAISFVLFLPCIFVEHNMAAREWKAIKSSVGADMKMPSPKLYVLVLLMVVCFLTRVNVTLNER